MVVVVVVEISASRDTVGKGEVCWCGGMGEGSLAEWTGESGSPLTSTGGKSFSSTWCGKRRMRGRHPSVQLV